MRLAVVSHKICWKTPKGYATDGGFPRQMKAISELFDSTRLVVPVDEETAPGGVSTLSGKSVEISPLSVPKGAGLRRKMDFPLWLARNGAVVWREVRRADAVHAPIPGDIGTIGMLFALLLKKPLFVRHCGNWMVQKTVAERVWKWLMEKFAGGRNVMLATGGAENAPSERNAHIKWIFSTSLHRTEMAASEKRTLPADGKIKLIVACRIEQNKGADIVVDSLPDVLRKFPNATLDVVGGGSLLNEIVRKAEKLNLRDRIAFHGKVEQSKVVELMKRAHVFCYPTSASEGFPKVVLEALACGLPVITTRVSVLPRLIGNGGGVLLDAPTAEQLANAVEIVCSNVEQYREMSMRASMTAQDYTLENWRDQIGENLRRAWNVESLTSAV